MARAWVAAWLQMKAALKEKGGGVWGGWLGSGGGGGGAGVAPANISRVHWSELSRARFVDEFAAAGRPLIVTGLGGALTPSARTFDSVVAGCGDLQVPVQRHEAGKVDAWAGMVGMDGGTSSIREVVAAVRAGAANGGRGVFDWSFAKQRK